MNKTTKLIFITGAVIVIGFGIKVVHTYVGMRNKLSDLLKITPKKFSITSYQNDEMQTKINLFVDNKTDFQFYVTDVKLNLIQEGKKLSTVNQKFTDTLIPANGTASIEFNATFHMKEIFSQGPALINAPLILTGTVGIKKGKFGYFSIPIKYTLPSLAQTGINILNNSI